MKEIYSTSVPAPRVTSTTFSERVGYDSKLKNLLSKGRIFRHVKLSNAGCDSSLSSRVGIGHRALDAHLDAFGFDSLSAETLDRKHIASV